MAEAKPTVAIVMGSQSDWSILREAAATLDSLGIAFKQQIVSAHRTPDRLVKFAKSAHDAGYKVIIAGAGGALPGMVAAMTPLPVLGVQSKPRRWAYSTVSLHCAIPPGAGRHTGHGPGRRHQCGAPRRHIYSFRILISAALDRRRAEQTAAVAEQPTDDAAKPG